MEIIVLILLIYFTGCVFYLLILSLASLMRAPQKKAKHDKLNTFAVLIPAYKENSIIINVSKSARQHNYPAELFDVYVIADSLEAEAIDAIRNNKCEVIEVQFESSTKAKSLNSALEVIPADKYDYAIILDVDNIMEPNFISLINDSINHGFDAVQGHRAAKNMNTPTAMLDAASEEIHNTIFRKGNRRIGLSAMLIGSAFAVKWDLFKRHMYDIRDVAGEDRELELKILAEKIKIEYCEEAIVLDEKVDTWENYTRQRSRWAAAHLDFFVSHFGESIKQLLFHFNIDYFNKIWQSLILPRIILIAILTVFFVVSLIFPNFPYASNWKLLFILNATAMFAALPGKFYSAAFAKSLLQLPRMFFAMLASWTKIKGQKNKFLHTPHNFDEAPK